MRALVIGGGVSGLVAARELALAGHETTVLEATDRWGGCVGSHVVAGLTLDSGAESFATRSSAVADLAGELGLAGSITAPLPGGAWVLLPAGPRELPRTGVLGIPANPWDSEVRRTLGVAGAVRATLDRFLPRSVGTQGDVTSVARLVRTRMGARVLERLVDPVVGGVHSADPALLDVDMVAPGLRTGLREHGSLAAAVAQMRRPGDGNSSSSGTADSSGASGTSGASKLSGADKAGSAVAGLRGGMHTLVAALTADLGTLGVALVPGSKVTSVRRDGDGAWTVAAGSADYRADHLVMALDGPAAVGLLAPAVPALAELRPAPGPDVRLVTLVVEKPALDSRPRGTGILVAPGAGGVQAKALTHATGKWQWLKDQAGPGHHVLRLSYGRRDGAPETGVADAGTGAGPGADQKLFTTALRDASTLLDVPIVESDVRGWDVVRWPGALPFAAVGHRQRVAEVRRICSEAGAVTVVGGWVAGNGLAAVVADTRRQLRREGGTP